MANVRERRDGVAGAEEAGWLTAAERKALSAFTALQRVVDVVLLMLIVVLV